MEEYESLKNVGRKLKNFAGDFIFANQTQRDLRHEESFVREFYPKRVPIGNSGLSIMLLETAKERIRSNRMLMKVSQPILTALYALPLMSYLGGRATEENSLLLAGFITFAKAAMFLVGRYEARSAAKLHRNYQEALENSSDRDHKGEEWKRETDYPFSDEPGF